MPALGLPRAPQSSLGCLAKVCSALVSQHLQPRALDQGVGDRSQAQGDPRQRGPRGSTREGHPSDRAAAWPAPEPRRRAGGSGGRGDTHLLRLPGGALACGFAPTTCSSASCAGGRRRPRVLGALPDRQSALNLAAARLRYIAGTAWSTKRYLNIELLKDQQMRDAITA